MRAGAALVALLLAPPLAAQDAGSQDDPACADAMTQTEMSACAAADLARADDRLNAVWRTAIARAVQMDGVGLSGMEDGLRGAQRLWIGFRDAACAVEAARYAGGSIAPMVRAGCLARLTRQRTADLELFAREG